MGLLGWWGGEISFRVCIFTIKNERLLNSDQYIKGNLRLLIKNGHMYNFSQPAKLRPEQNRLCFQSILRLRQARRDEFGWANFRLWPTGWFLRKKPLRPQVPQQCYKPDRLGTRRHWFLSELSYKKFSSWNRKDKTKMFQVDNFWKPIQCWQFLTNRIIPGVSDRKQQE